MIKAKGDALLQRFGLNKLYRNFFQLEPLEN